MPYSADATKILTRTELQSVLAELRRKAPSSKNTRLNLVIFRLSACCGLRASEIAQLQMSDVRVEMPRPHIRIRVGASKGGRSRRVPLWWDGGTLADLAAWRADRAAHGATGGDPFVASLQAGREALVFSRHTLRKRFRTACRVLGKERLQSLTIHHGRHTFISHALAGGRTLAEVRDAAGHSNVTITSGYLHVAVEGSEVGTLFGSSVGGSCQSNAQAMRLRDWNRSFSVIKLRPFDELWISNQPLQCMARRLCVTRNSAPVTGAAVAHA